MPLTRPKAAQVNFDITNLTDPLIRLNSGQTGSNNKDTGIVLERGDDTNVALMWDESADTFALINTDEDGTTGGDVTIASYADLTLKRITQSEQQYTTSNMMKFNQYYLGNAIGGYHDPNEYQKVLTITPASDNENYQVSGRIMAQNAGDIHIVHFTAALRSGTRPDLSWTISYTEEYNGSRYIDPQLWTKETSTAGFIVAFKVLSRIFGTVTVDIDVIPRSASLKSNVVMNTAESSEQTTIDTGFTANDMTKVSTSSGTSITHVGSLTANAFHGDGSNLTGITSGLFTAITDGGSLTSTESGSAAGPIIELDRNSVSPFNADYLGQLKFKGRNSTDQTVIYGKISAKASDVTDGSEDGTLEFTVMNNGTQDNIVRINENGLYINAGADLKFEGATGNAHETTVTLTDPTADRTITLPDATGTVALTNSFTRFHSAVQTVTTGEASTNVSAQVTYTFSDLNTAIHFNVYMNRMLLRPAEFSVSGSTLTINIGIIDTDDQLEVTGFKV